MERTALQEALDSGALSPMGDSVLVPFPKLGWDARVHPLSLRRMQEDEAAVSQLVGVLFKLAELASPANDEETQISDAQFWAVVMHFLPSSLLSVARIASSCVTWERRPGTPADAPEPKVDELSHVCLPLLINAFVEASFPDPFAISGWVATLARISLALSTAEDSSEQALTTIRSLLDLSRSSDSAPEQSESESDESSPDGTGSETE